MMFNVKIPGRHYIMASGLVTGMAVTASAPAAVTVCNIDMCRQRATTNVSSDYAKTRYPQVMVHGMGGGNDSWSDKSYYYFHGIPEDLSRNGAEVYLPKVSAFNSTEVRGEQLLKQLKLIQAVSGQSKFNLLGHSHGGPTVRYILGVAPQMVASVTTVGSPNKGSVVADNIRTDARKMFLGMPFLQFSGIIAGNILNLIPSSPKLYPEDPVAGLNSLTTDGSADFNRRFPVGIPVSSCGEGEAQSNGIPLFSWSGTGILTNWFDISDYWVMQFVPNFRGEANDGLVSRCSSHFGKVLRDNYNMNHADEINQIKGLGAWGVDVPSVYRAQANRLKNLGL